VKINNGNHQTISKRNDISNRISTISGGEAGESGSICWQRQAISNMKEKWCEEIK
jgi:hypothetical protein